ncbi:hypothetical protein HBI64_172540 [Parastagonospora nodorum]|nr:hypothetical protein HBI09_074680 [Parastagonospora nodorum]KAH5015746.1 hypothetical protein HBI77_063170 [Parastagonospora nodorum]KAH5381917.1 hypothetical protein HBI33_138550 [Parastagonospora nodorum]KAH6119543.1 hypothetical protein HBI64_172540 [Parastagonospora nodorum]
MFTSHKGDMASQSRQSSVDMSATLSLSSASTTDRWASQGFEELPYGVMQSPERKVRAHPSKRTSVFNMRSRSNTAASTSSTVPSMSPPTISHFDSSRPGTPSYDELSGSMKALFRGKKGKRLSESVSSNMMFAEYQEKEASDKRTSVLRKVKRKYHHEEALPAGLKHRISSPFGFQHLTHADRQHHAVYEHAAGNKLSSGFRTVPTSAATGANESQLHFSNFSSENLAGSDHQSFTQSPQIEQSGSPVQGHDRKPALRLTRSVESFSQPGVNMRNHRHSQSVLAPPRMSSLAPLAPIHDLPEDANQHVGNHPSARRSKRESGVWDSFSLASVSAEPSLPGTKDENVYLGHAFTTPDDTAIPAMPLSFSPCLDDVSEEPEYFSRPRPAPRPPARSPSTPRSPYFDSMIFSNPRSPKGRRRNRALSHTSPRSTNQGNSTSRPGSQASETLGSASFGRHSLARKPSTKRRQSNTWRMFEESWEEDIDYIYDNALEADCDLEWDRVSDVDVEERLHSSFDQTYRQGRRASSSVEPLSRGLEPAFEPTTRDFRVSLLVPNVPDLVPTSATSVSTPGTGLTTPCDPFQGRSEGQLEGFMVSPSLLVPQEYKDDQEHMYEEMLNAYDDSDRHFPMLDPRHSATSSARSRRSSYDSSLMSSIQGSALWSSPVRRSASSAGSVPDLVPSRRTTRRDLSFSLVVDQLSDSVASLSHLDEEKEDNDITPPGRTLGNRTFFPAADESEEPSNDTIDIGEKLKASLELARHSSRGSRHSQARHKPARSDGAANLLAAASDLPTKPRRRAATASGRSPLLNLFPTPPQSSPSLH